jgi:outer membrane lipoprotein SlyB
MARTAVGLIATPERAQRLLDDLIQNGFRHDDISLVSRDDQGLNPAEHEAIGSVEKGAKAGAAVGGVTGAVAGATRGGSSAESNVIGLLVGVAGAVAGNAIERMATREDAVEVLVQLKGGERRAVVQAKGEQTLMPGDAVILVTTGGKVRIAKAPR